MKVRIRKATIAGRTNVSPQYFGVRSYSGIHDQPRGFIKNKFGLDLPNVPV